MSPVECIVVVAVALLVPLGFMAAVQYEFAEGALAKRVDVPEWRKHWVALAAASAGAALCASAVEAVFFDRGVVEVASWGVTAALVLIAAWADVKESIVPNGVVVVFLLAGVLALAVGFALEPERWQMLLISHLVGALLCPLVLLAARLITRGGVGFGDVKLYFGLGLLLGAKGALNVLIYSVVAAFVVAVFALLLKKKTVNDSLPLAPFTFIGVVLAVVFGA